MRLTLNCRVCNCRALVTLDDELPASDWHPEATWRCPLCGSGNTTRIIASVVSVVCQCDLSKLTASGRALTQGAG